MATPGLMISSIFSTFTVSADTPESATAFSAYL